MEGTDLQVVAAEEQERIVQAIQGKRWTQVEEFWSEISTSEPRPLSFHQPIIDRLIRKSQHPEKLEHFYGPLLSAYIDNNGAEYALDIIQYILSINDKQEWLRIPLVQSLRLTYSESAGDRINEFVERSGLQEEDSSLRKGLIKFEDMMGAAKGQVFQHQNWGLGVVRDLDINTGRVVIDFALKKNQTMTLDGVRSYLQRIPKDHLLAKMALDPEGLKATISSRPSEAVTLALQSNGGRIKVSEMKRLLTTRFLTDNEYKNFWEKARKAIKLDPWIDQNGTGTHAELYLRTSPRTFFDQMFAQLLKATTVAERREVLRDISRHESDAELTPEDRDSLYQVFMKPHNDGLLKEPHEKAAHGLLFDEFSHLFDGKANSIDVDEILLQSNAVDVLERVPVNELRRLAMERLIELHPEEWPEMFVELTIFLDGRTVSWMEKELANRGHEGERQRALERILARPDRNPDLFVWAARNILEGSWGHLDDTIKPIMICDELLSLLSEIEDHFESDNKELAAAMKNAATKIRSVLNEGNSKHFKKAAQKCTVDEARRILYMVRLHNSLSNQMKAQLEGILLNEHPDLRKVSRSEEEEEKKKPAYHYTTQAALEEKRTMLSNLVGKEIPAMAPVIEAARELGDLKENSEYHSAKDRQKLLMQQAAELEDLIARARVVEEKDFIPDTSRFGTRVTLRDLSTLEEKQVTLLGMWEADVANNIISYLTPMGAQLMNRKIGEQFAVTAQDGTTLQYEVLAIESVLGSAGN